MPTPIEQRLKTLDDLDRLLDAIAKCGRYLAEHGVNNMTTVNILGRAITLSTEIIEERNAILFAIHMTTTRGRQSPWNI